MHRSFRRVWLPTLTFVGVAMIVGARLVSLRGGLELGLCFLVTTPIIWWLICGRGEKTRVWQGAIAGALIGFASEIAPLLAIPVFNLTHSGNLAGGGDQSVDFAATLLFGAVALAAAPIGCVIGALIVPLERALKRS